MLRASRTRSMRVGCEGRRKAGRDRVPRRHHGRWPLAAAGRGRRLASGPSLVLLAVLASACAAPVPSASPPLVALTPVPNVTAPPRATEAPLADEWRGKTIDDAIDALDAVHSYRFSVHTQFDTNSGVIVNGDSPAVVLDSSSTTGSLPARSIVIGDDEWRSLAGGTWEHEVRKHVDEDGTAILYDDSFRHFLPEAFSGFEAGPGNAFAFYPPFVDVGREARDGVEARHVRAVGDGTLAQPDDGSTIEGEAFLGTVDAWIAVDGGYLVEVRID